MNHGADAAESYQPFAREEGIFVSADADGEEIRLHRDENGRFNVIRWRVHRERGWIGPLVMWFSATEIYDMAAALRREADGKKMPAKGAKTRS
jgi:hypothetical protein